jgi:SAM-dependent methyltransferase
MTPKQVYSKYIADDTLSELSNRLITEITICNPLVVLDFGSGSGKHSNELQKIGIETIGIDISMMNVVRAHSKYDLPAVICADERILKFIHNIDLVFSCSVLDHIEDIGIIIDEFKRMARVVMLAETRDAPGDFYYPHDYENYGFKKLDYSYVSEPPNGDGATYEIWKWEKGQNESIHINDDLG